MTEALAVQTPSWAAASNVKALFTTRQGGVSTGPWGNPQGSGGLNLGANCGDLPERVALNRQRLARHAGVPIRWLNQVHGIRVLEVEAEFEARTGAGDMRDSPGACAAASADAQITTASGIALGVLVADCLPVLLADRAGSIVGVAHAGWRGLSAGVLEQTIAAMRLRRPGAELVAWLGPCIGAAAFEVGEEVREVFVAHDARASARFVPGVRRGKWWADLAGLARQRLEGAGVGAVACAAACTVTNRTAYWSYRRDGKCGRMAGVIWLEG